MGYLCRLDKDIIFNTIPKSSFFFSAHTGQLLGSCNREALLGHQSTSSGGGRCSRLSSGSSCQRTDPNSSSASPTSIAFGVGRSVHVKEGWVKVKSIGESSQ